MEELAEAIYQFGERHRKTILVIDLIVGIIMLIALGAIENGNL